MRGLVGAEQDGPGCVLARGLAAIAGARHRIHVRAGGVEVGVHVGDLALDKLEVADGFAELLAVMNIGQHRIHTGLHDAQRSAGEHHAFIVQATHQHLHAAVFRAQNIRRRHLAILEHQFTGVGTAHAQFVELGRAAETGKIPFHQERGDAMGAGIRIGAGIDHIDMGIGPVGDPHLAAIEHIHITLAAGAEFHAHHIGAGIVLAHGQRANGLATDQAGQVALLLRVVAVAVNLIDTQVGVGTVTQADTGRGTADFLSGDDMGQIPQAGATVLLRDRDTQQAQVAHFAPQVSREVIVAVNVGSARRYLVGSKLADLRLQHHQCFVQIKIQLRVQHGIGLLLFLPEISTDRF